MSTSYKVIHIIALLIALCVCIAFVSCGKDEIHFSEYISDKDIKVLDIILNRYESSDVRWYVGYSDNTGEMSEEIEVAPFDKRDYKAFSSLKGLESLYIAFGDDVTEETANTLLQNIPDAQYIGFAGGLNVDFTYLKDHKWFNDVAFTNHCDLKTLPVLDARMIAFSGCSNIPWQTVSEMKSVETIRYSGKETLDAEAFSLMSQMYSLEVLVYNAVPYDNWNWGEDGSEYTQPPYKITSMDDIEEWVYKTIDKETIREFLGNGDRTLVLMPYAETNPGVG